MFSNTTQRQPFQTKVKLRAIILKDNKKSKNDFLYQTGVRVITMKHKRTMQAALLNK